MFNCDRCTGEFNVYSSPGKCPLCDQWVKLECSNCGHSGSSRYFIEAGDKCPNCHRDTKIPGRHKTNYFLVAGMIVLITAFILVMYVFATFKASSRPLPNIPFRTTKQLPP